MVKDVIENSWKKNSVSMSDDGDYYMNKMRDFMFNRVYFTAENEQMQLKADRMLNMLFKYFIAHPDEVPHPECVTDVTTFVCDYLASMSDTYAISLAKKIFIPDGIEL
jgi:dGTPase